MRRISNIFWLGTKELRSFARDPVLVALVIWAFSFSIITIAQSSFEELRDASIAIVDEDHSELSRRLSRAFMPPYFKPPVSLAERDIDRMMNVGRYTFVVDIPPRFQTDVLAGRPAAIQVNVDATAMSQAGRGAGYLQSVIAQELQTFVARSAPESPPPARLVVQAKFNPNLMSTWFNAVMQIVNNITMLAIILSGAALMREREHGTIEHLLVMPLRPVEIMLAKVWANALVIVVVSAISLRLIVQDALGVPIAGSIPLFMFCTLIYMFSVTALGIFLATLTRSMPQFGLLAFLVFIVMNQLSGATTPLDSMPLLLQQVMQISPTTHFVAVSQTILYRGGGLEAMWPHLAAVAGIGLVFLTGALLRFRKAVTALQA